MVVEVWWSPAEQCYRIEDRGIMLTFFSPEEAAQYIAGLPSPSSAVVPTYPGNSREHALVNALLRAGIAIAYQSGYKAGQ